MLSLEDLLHPLLQQHRGDGLHQVVVDADPKQLDGALEVVGAREDDRRRQGETLRDLGNQRRAILLREPQVEQNHRGGHGGERSPGFAERSGDVHRGNEAERGRDELPDVRVVVDQQNRGQV